jgi:predicted amidophosphoribosyltransferase
MDFLEDLFDRKKKNKDKYGNDREHDDDEYEEGSKNSFCPGCGSRIKEGDRFCPGCGKEAKASARICPRCKSKLEENAKFCPACGNKI